MSKKNNWVAHGPCLGLRRLAPEHVGDAYLRWMNDPEVVRFTEARHQNYTLDDLQTYVRTYSESKRDYLLGIFEIKSGLHVGNIKVGPVDLRHGTASVGLIIGEKECWGRGYGTEVIRLAAEFAFECLGLAKLTAGVIEGHAASQRAFEKNGFLVEGVRRKQNLFEGKRHDEILLGLLREEWHSA